MFKWPNYVVCSNQEMRPLVVNTEQWRTSSGAGVPLYRRATDVKIAGELSPVPLKGVVGRSELSGPQWTNGAPSDV